MIKIYYCFLIHKLAENYPIFKYKYFKYIFGLHFCTYSLPTYTKNGLIYSIDCICGAKYSVIIEDTPSYL
jgi:hypothetical protein